MQTIAFDVYGTLINTHGLIEQLETLIGDQAKGFSQTWRDKQLEYSFRRGLMRQYQDFNICTKNALDYACLFHDCPLTVDQKQQLLTSYASLPAFDDVNPGLAMVQQKGHHMFAFSNGKPEAVEGLLNNAQIATYFAGVVSVDAIQSFKPDPKTYTHFLKETGANVADAWLVSSNPFDIIGAHSVGMQTAWVKRLSTAIFDPWGVEPTLTVGNITELAEQIAGE